MKTKAGLSGYRMALIAKFIHRDVTGGVILAGRRAGQTASWAGIDGLLILVAWPAC
jgi:hypothetical protein